MNALFHIVPYKHEGLWVFDDERFGLVREPLIEGVPEMIERLTGEHGIEDPEEGFVVTFGFTSFPGYHLELDLIGPDFGGHRYRADDWGMECWLCPALLHYTPSAPDSIYVKVSGLPMRKPAGRKPRR